MPLLARPRAALSRSVGVLPATYWYLWVGTLVNRLGSFVIPFMSLYLTQARHLSVSDAGWIVSTWGVGSTLAGPIGGGLADRIGRRTTLLMALALGGAMVITLGLVHALWAIALLAFLSGLISDCNRPAVSAAIADLVPPEHRVLAYGTLYWAVNLGFSIALVLAGFLAHYGYLTLFIGDGLTTLGYALIIFLRVPETLSREPHHVAARASQGSLRGLWVALRDPVLMAFVLLSLLLGCLYQQSVVGLPLDLAAHGFPTTVYGTLLALNGIIIILVQPFATHRLRRFRRGMLLAVAALLTGFGFGANAWARSIPVYALGIAIWTLGEILGATFSPAIVSDLAPASLRGTYQGLYTMSWGFAAFAGPALGAWIFGHLGARTLWIGCAVAGAAIALGHIAITPARRRRLGELGLGHTEDALRG